MKKMKSVAEAAGAKAAGSRSGKAAARKAPAKRRVEFVIEAGIGRTVSIAGSFNDWDPEAKLLADRDGDGVFRCVMMLPPGEYEYKFVVDGDWRIDEGNPWFASNDLGTLNSVLKIEV